MKRLLTIFFALTAIAAAQVVIPWTDVDKTGANPTLTINGDASGSATFTSLGNATLSLTLGNTTVTPGTYGSATQSLTATVDAKGRITNIAAQTVTPAWGSITAKPTTAAGFGITNGTAIDNFAAAQSGTAQNLTTGAGPTFATLSLTGGSLALATANNNVIDVHRASALNDGIVRFWTNGNANWILGARAVGDNGFYLYNYATAANALSFDTSSNATFASVVTVNGGTVTKHLTGYGRVAEFDSHAADIISEIRADADGYARFGTASNHSVALRTNATDRLKIAAAGAVTIGSNADLGGSAISSFVNSGAQSALYAHNYNPAGYGLYVSQGQTYFNGAVTQAAGSYVVAGSSTWGALQATRLFYNSSSGATLAGWGTSWDVALLNKNGDVALYVPTGTQTLNTPGGIVAAGALNAQSGTFKTNGQNVSLVANVGSGAAWVGFYDSDGATRYGYIGRASGGSTTLTIANDASGGAIALNPGAGAGVSISGTSAIKGVRTATTSYDFGTMANGSGVYVDVTATGVASGDAVQTNFTDGVVPDGFVLSGFVVATNTVRVRLTNINGGTVAVGGRAFRVTAFSF